ncbi:syndecan-like [Sarcoptes scabiei]|nr:syndecan-like [Sarcoptes scabiei]
MIISSVLIFQLCYHYMVKAESEPKLSPIIEKNFKNLHSKLKILCTAQYGSKPIEFEWLHNDEILANQNGHYRFESSDEDSLLIIEKLLLNDSGDYTCIARNRFGFDRQHTKVIVTGNNNFDVPQFQSNLLRFRSMCGALFLGF